MESYLFVKNALQLTQEEARVFLPTIEVLLENEKVQEMHMFRQHANKSCLEHCLHVAYISYRIAKKLNLDAGRTARGALLHDFFLYDWRVTQLEEGKHAFHHPYRALKQAQSQFDLHPMEEDIIVKHMWPVTFSLPRFKESWVVLCVDKYCACVETFSYLGTVYQEKYLNK